MKNLFTIFFSVLSFHLLAQNSFMIQFQPQFNGYPLELNKKYFTQNDTVIIETLKFYVSDIEFYNENAKVDMADKKHYLLDLENPSSLIIKHKTSKSFNFIKFKIGVDSLTNVSGVFGEDLDPTNGMYWTWQSGYIHFKLEGKSNLCIARNNRFQFHIGGYGSPFNSIQEKTLKVNKKNCIILIPIDKLLEKLDLSKIYEVMSPSQKAVDISKHLVSLLEISK